MILLGVMDLELALKVERPVDITKKSSSDDDKRGIEKWDGSSRMSHMIMKRVIPEAFRSIMFEQVTTIKDFLEEIKKGL